MTKFQKNPGSPYSIIHDNTVRNLDVASHGARAEAISPPSTPGTAGTPGTLNTLVLPMAVLSGTEWRNARA